MRILLDTNVVLDGLLRRTPFDVEARAIWQACADGRAEGFVSAITPVNLFYIARKQVGAPQARVLLTDLLVAFGVCAIDSAVLLAADRLAVSDYEDAVQVAAAVAVSLDAIVTRDTSDYAGVPIPVFTPADFLNQLSMP